MGGVIGACQRNEMVRYKKRDYKVSFICSDSAKAYRVKVRRPGRPMKNDAKDRNNATQVAISTVSCYTCPKNQRAKAIAGSVSHGGNQWAVSARCALT